MKMVELTAEVIIDGTVDYPYFTRDEKRVNILSRRIFKAYLDEIGLGELVSGELCQKTISCAHSNFDKILGKAGEKSKRQFIEILEEESPDSESGQFTLKGCDMIKINKIRSPFFLMSRKPVSVPRG